MAIRTPLSTAGRGSRDRRYAQSEKGKAAKIRYRAGKGKAAHTAAHTVYYRGYRTRRRAELTRLIAEQAKDARRYQIGSNGLEFWDVYRLEPDSYPPRETHRTRITSEPGWDERRQAA